MNRRLVLLVLGVVALALAFRPAKLRTRAERTEDVTLAQDSAPAKAQVADADEAKTCEVTFVCRDERDAPVPADLRCFGPSGREVRAEANPEGIAVLDLPKGESWECVAEAPSHAWAFAAFTVTAATRHELVFRNPAAIDGIVETAAGVPLAGVSVTLWPALRPGPNAPALSRMTRHAKSDARGRFAADGLVAGQTYELRAAKNDTVRVVPPQSVRIRIDAPCLLELERDPRATLDLVWQTRSLEPSPLAGVIDPAPYDGASGSWPHAVKRIVTPIWPGRTHIRVKLRHGGHRRRFEATVKLPEEGGRRKQVVALGAGVPVLRVRNPHAHPAGIYRWPANAEDDNVRTTIPPGAVLALPVPPGTHRFASAVYPNAVESWTAVSGTDVEVPLGAAQPAVAVVRSTRRPVAFLRIAPIRSTTAWHAAYHGTKPQLVTGIVQLRTERTLVVQSFPGLRYRLEVPGRTYPDGAWPAGGVLELNADR